jgi:hypothetical protein
MNTSVVMDLTTHWCIAQDLYVSRAVVLFSGSQHRCMMFGDGCYWRWAHLYQNKES